MGPHKGEVLWGELEHSRVLWVLHHPRYAGAFCFGRSRQRNHPDGHTLCVRLPREEWTALIHDAHEAYITWDEFEENLQRAARQRPRPGRRPRGGAAPRGSGPVARSGDLRRVWRTHDDALPQLPRAPSPSLSTLPSLPRIFNELEIFRGRVGHYI